MTPTEQLESWVQGINLHNSTRDECCPRFSISFKCECLGLSWETFSTDNDPPCLATIP